MADPNWERYSAGTGLGAAILLALQAFIAPLYPTFNDSVLEVASYYHKNASAIRVQLLLTGLAGVLFLWFLGSLRVHLRRAEGTPGRLSAVAFGSGIAAAGVGAIGALTTATAVRIAEGGAMLPLGPTQELPGVGALVPLNDMRLLAYALTWFALVPLLAATAVVSARSGAFPRWHMNATYVLALLSAGSALSVLLDSGLFAPGAAYDLVLFGLFLGWLGVTSWLIMRALAPPAETEVPTAPAVPEPPPAN